MRFWCFWGIHGPFGFGGERPGHATERWCLKCGARWVEVYDGLGVYWRRSAPVQPNAESAAANPGEQREPSSPESPVPGPGGGSDGS